MPVAEQAHPYSEIQGQTRVHAPVVLHVRFIDVIAVVVVELSAVLLKGFDPAVSIGPGKEEIRKRVSRTIKAADIAESQDALQVSSIRSHRLVQFVSLRDHDLNSSLERVLANHFAQIIAKVIGRVGVVPRQIAGVHAESITSVSLIRAPDYDSRYFAAEPVVEQVARRQTRWPLPLRAIGIDVVEVDVIGGVTKDEFVQQRRRDGVGQMGQHAESGPGEIAFNSGKAVLKRAPL